MARSASSRLHLAPKNMTALLDAHRNPDLDRSPVEVMQRLKCDFVPVLETVHDQRGQVIEGVNNIVAPGGRSLGTSGDRFTPMGMPKLAEVCGKLQEAIPATRMLAGWQTGGGARYGYRLMLGEAKAVAKPGDLMGLFIDVVGSNDCSTTWSVSSAIVRLICSNGMTKSDNLSYSFGRHTMNAELKINQSMIRSIVEITSGGHESLNQIAGLANKPMSEMQVRQFFAAYAAKMEAKNDDRARQMVTDLITLMGRETQAMAMTNGVATAWTAYNAITEYNSYSGTRDYAAAFFRQLGGNHINANEVAYDLLAA